MMQRLRRVVEISRASAGLMDPPASSQICPRFQTVDFTGVETELDKDRLSVLVSGAESWSWTL